MDERCDYDINTRDYDHFNSGNNMIWIMEWSVLITVIRV